MTFQVIAQKQLIFLQRETVVARFTEGDNFKFKLKNGQKKDGFIVELLSYSMITSNEDTIAFLKIGKIKGLRRNGFTNKLGRILFFGGFGYVAIDQLNGALGYGRKGWDNSDRNGLIAGGIGAMLLFIKPRYLRLKPGTIIRSIDYKSPYYLQREK